MARTVRWHYLSLDIKLLAKIYGLYNFRRFDYGRLIFGHFFSHFEQIPEKFRTLLKHNLNKFTRKNTH